MNLLFCMLTTFSGYPIPSMSAESEGVVVSGDDTTSNVEPFLDLNGVSSAASTEVYLPLPGAAYKRVKQACTNCRRLKVFSPFV